MMIEKSVTVQNKDALGEVLKGENDPEVKRKLSFTSLAAAAGMEVIVICIKRYSGNLLQRSENIRLIHNILYADPN